MKCLPLVLILFVFLKEIRAESQFVMDDGLELTLSASEPEILSLSNIDVDHKGRVWACEVINYGPNKGCLLYTSPSPRDKRQSRMPSSA